MRDADNYTQRRAERYGLMNIVYVALPMTNPEEPCASIYNFTDNYYDFVGHVYSFAMTDHMRNKGLIGLSIVNGRFGPIAMDIFPESLHNLVVRLETGRTKGTRDYAE
jgi:hypothetical protein